VLKKRQNSFISTNKAGKFIERCINNPLLNTPLLHVVTKCKGVWSPRGICTLNTKHVQMRSNHNGPQVLNVHRKPIEIIILLCLWAQTHAIYNHFMSLFSINKGKSKRNKCMSTHNSTHTVNLTINTIPSCTNNS
jgi:hypothetical protein